MRVSCCSWPRSSFAVVAAAAGRACGRCLVRLALRQRRQRMPIGDGPSASLNTSQYQKLTCNKQYKQKFSKFFHQKKSKLTWISTGVEVFLSRLFLNLTFVNVNNEQICVAIGVRSRWGAAWGASESESVRRVASRRLLSDMKKRTGGNCFIACSLTLLFKCLDERWYFWRPPIVCISYGIEVCKNTMALMVAHVYVLVLVNQIRTDEMWPVKCLLPVTN